jgi:hypothetical protein
MRDGGGAALAETRRMSVRLVLGFALALAPGCKGMGGFASGLGHVASGLGHVAGGMAKVGGGIAKVAAESGRVVLPVARVVGHGVGVAAPIAAHLAVDALPIAEDVLEAAAIADGNAQPVVIVDPPADQPDGARLVGPDDPPPPALDDDDELPPLECSADCGWGEPHDLPR